MQNMNDTYTRSDEVMVCRIACCNCVMVHGVAYDHECKYKHPAATNAIRNACRTRHICILSFKQKTWSECFCRSSMRWLRLLYAPTGRVIDIVGIDGSWDALLVAALHRQRKKAPWLDSEKNVRPKSKALLECETDTRRCWWPDCSIWITTWMCQSGRETPSDMMSEHRQNSKKLRRAATPPYTTVRTQAEQKSKHQLTTTTTDTYYPIKKRWVHPDCKIICSIQNH